MKAEVITDWEPLKLLGTEWNALLQRSRANSIFLTWEWMEAWHGAAGQCVEPVVIAVRDPHGALVGLAPFYRAELRLLGLLSYRVLRMLGDHHSGAEYPDWILAPECEQEAAQAILGALLAVSPGWDCLWIPRLAGWTGAYERIVVTCSAHGLHCRQRACEFSATALPEDSSSYVRSLSRNARSALKRQNQQVFSSPSATFEQCRSVAELPAYLDALVDLNHRRWSATGQVGTFVRKPLEQRFYRLFGPRALERGWLRLFAIRMNGRFAAVQVGYAYNQSFLQLQEGFDPEGPPGLGNVLRGKVIERCIREGIRQYDFLGGHTEHKRRWLANPRNGHDLLISRRCFRNGPLISLPLWPTGRYLREAGLPAPEDPPAGFEVDR